MRNWAIVSIVDNFVLEAGFREIGLPILSFICFISTLRRSWSPVDRKPIRYYPAVSYWQDELGEIRQECDEDVWSSWPYN